MVGQQWAAHFTNIYECDEQFIIASQSERDREQEFVWHYFA